MLFEYSSTTSLPSHGCTPACTHYPGKPMKHNPQLSFRALSDSTRLEILRQLSQQELTITEVVNKFDLTRTAVRKHLTILEEGKLISITTKGKERVSKLNPIGFKSASDWFNYFDQYWDCTLVSLKNAIEKDTQSQSRRRKSKRKKST